MAPLVASPSRTVMAKAWVVGTAHTIAAPPMVIPRLRASLRVSPAVESLIVATLALAVTTFVGFSLFGCFDFLRFVSAEHLIRLLLGLDCFFLECLPTRVCRNRTPSVVLGIDLGGNYQSAFAVTC